MNKNIEIDGQVISGERAGNGCSSHEVEIRKRLHYISKSFPPDSEQEKAIYEISGLLSCMRSELDLLFETLVNIKQSFDEFKIIKQNE